MSAAGLNIARPINAVLVANRGEIARRIIRTARQMGLRCIAVYVDADADAPFVADADVAVRLPGTYLDGEAIIAAAVAAGADAIHPGYGYLSENAGFAKRVTESDMTWVGPAPDAIRAMGDKVEAKAIAVEAGLPVLASTAALTDECGDAGAEIGYPLLVKAAAGGGGKGMRIVASRDGLEEAVASARREAAAGFDDDRVFLERYVPRSRHIEIQIVGDEYGNLLHLGERECSIQRRHQKIVEEAPSPFLTPAARAAMVDAALTLARALGYRSVGTVEFLVDDETGEFFFLEVNTRLQVEHPVTEEITGLDLVRLQLEIAAGSQLAVSQDDIAFVGHSIEVRINAEDPSAEFLPATGTIDALHLPAEAGIRWESGVAEGSVVGIDFDPMLAKAIATGPTRAEAARRLARGLESLHLGGVITNRAYLVALLRSPEFLAGDTTTDFIDRVDLVSPPGAAAVQRAAKVAALYHQHQNRVEAPVWASAPSGWRNARLPDQQLVLSPIGAPSEGDTAKPITVRYRSMRDGSFRFGDGSVGQVTAADADTLAFEIDGQRTTSRITATDLRIYVQALSGTVGFVIEPRFTTPGRELPTGSLVAPMPGVVLEVRVRPGDQVVAGQVVVVLEAMKMEHHLRSGSDGVVSDVPVKAGDQLTNGALLVAIEEHAADQNAPEETETGS